jgi:hypothetical protein
MLAMRKPHFLITICDGQPGNMPGISVKRC